MSLLVQPGNYPFLINTRAYIPGRLETRAGIVKVNSNALGGIVHTLKRLNDPLPNNTFPYTILVGVGGNIFSGQIAASPSVFSQIDQNYSGNPLGMVAYRPPRSPESWLYVSDSNQMHKLRTDSTVFPQGIAPRLPLRWPTSRSLFTRQSRVSTVLVPGDGQRTELKPQD